MLLFFSKSKIKSITPNIIAFSIELLEFKISNTIIKPDILEYDIELITHNILKDDISLLNIGLDRELRYEDISLNRYIQKELIKAGFYNVNVLDGYQEYEELTLPSISLEHIMSSDSEIELGNKDIYNERDYQIEIYARTKGERDDLISYIAKMTGEDLITVDKRKLEIKKINSIMHTPLDKRSYPIHKNWFYLDLDGFLSYCKIDNFNKLTTNTTLDFDIYVSSDQYQIHNNFTLFDNYSEYKTDGTESKNGIKIYLDKNNILTCKVGIDQVNLLNSIDFTQYLNNRIRFTFSLIQNRSTFIAIIYINSVEVSRTSEITFNRMDYNLNKHLFLGASHNDSNTSHSNCKMKLYMFSISNKSKVITYKTEEKLPYDINIDFIYMLCNEGIDNKIYNNLADTSQLKDYDFATIYNGYNWILYFTDKSEHSICRHGVIDLSTSCIKVL